MLTVKLGVNNTLVATTEDGKDVLLTEESAFRLLRQYLKAEPRKLSEPKPQWKCLADYESLGDGRGKELKHYDARGRRTDPGFVSLRNGDTLDLTHLLGA